MQRTITWPKYYDLSKALDMLDTQIFTDMIKKQFAGNEQQLLLSIIQIYDTIEIVMT